MNRINVLMSIMLMCIGSNSIQAQEEKKQHDKWITIFVHGSFSLRPHLGIRNMLKMLYDTIEESIYYRSTEINRRDPFFYKNQAMSGLGLHKIDINHLHNNAAAPILAASFEEVANQAGYPQTDEYYTFGWSGLISNKLRYLEAAFLYQDLERISKKLQRQGYNPRVRLIGYSHGGNLALQLGALHSTKTAEEIFYVDELWLLGTPIQVETDYLINSPIFKKVFNFYSRADRVQTLDFFSFKRFFSSKKFTKRRNFKIPDKLHQVRLKITMYEPSARKYNDITLTNDPEKLKKYFKELNFDPGHFELWFMGWTILTYRQTFPLYPLPILTFLPLIVHYLDQHPNIPHDIVANIKPNFNLIDFTPYHTVKSSYRDTISFVDANLLKHMQYHVSQFTPDDYNIDMYNQKVYGAMNIAEHEWKEISRLLKLEKKRKKVLPRSINLHKYDEAYQGHIPAS